MSIDPVKIDVHCDSAKIRIGAQTKVHLSVSYPKGKTANTIQWPELKDTLIKNIVLVNTSATDTATDPANPNQLTLSKHYTITSFDSGYYAIPPFKVYLNKDTAHPYQSDPFLLQVNNVQADTTQAIKDIKPPLSEPFKISELAPYFYGLLALAVLIIAGYYVVRNLFKKKEMVVEPPKPKVPPHETAMVALEKLRQEKTWQEGKFKFYYSQLSDIVRIYIEGRFKVQALEQTTDELMSNFKYIVIDEQSKLILKELLMISDLVKFAKEEPLPAENELSIEKAIQFVKGTARLVNAEPTANATANATDNAESK